jgi:predicted HD superfamily hydrolase involved in NAD metabolism
MITTTTTVRATPALPTLDEVRAYLEREVGATERAHVFSVAAIARELAEIHGVDPERAELAALMHDLADGYSDRQLLDLADRFGIPISLTQARIPRLLHGAVGAELLREKWGITDEEVLDAIRDHISGGNRMTKLAKIVFVADKIEPSRDRHYGGLEPVRKVARVNLDEAMLKLYAWRIDELVNSGRPVDERLVNSRNMLIENVRNNVL